MFYSSPRNRPEVQISLLDKLQCSILFTPEEESETTLAVLAGRPHMRKHFLPTLASLLSPDSPVEPYPYTKTFEDARADPYVTLHSSGSTGTPKILLLKQGSAAAHDAFQLFPSQGGTPWFVSSWTGKRVLTNFPWVHAGGAHIISAGLFNDFVPVIPAAWPLTGADANHLHLNANVQAAWYSPSVCIDIARDPTYLHNISVLENVSYSGGILPKAVGDAISKHTRIFGSMASTETGILPSEIPPPQLWDYYRFNSALGHKFRHYADDMYELVIEKQESNESSQGVFFTFLGTKTYEMRDLYIEHKTQKGWWRSSGRVDDVVIMADAKKLNTIPYEAVIEQHPGVATALICGTGRPRPAVLIQPRTWSDTDKGDQHFVDDVWPTIQRANEAGPVYGRLIKTLVVVVKQAKPMERAGGKDTVMRKRSLALYQDEIDEAYRRAEELGSLYGEVADQGHLV